MDLRPYRLALAEPLVLADGSRHTHREGLLLHDPETDGWGEAAPLPGFSLETLAQVGAAARDGDFAAFPSLRFAAECAGQPPPRVEQAVAVNALWFPERESVASLLARLQGFTVVKIKAGPRPAPWLELLRARPDLRLRLDANRRWSVEDALRVFDALPADALDYLEEPFADPADYERLWAEAPVPIALDESLGRPGGERLAHAPGVRALVLKPTLLGDANDRAFWVGLAQKRGLSLVWSSCFESGVGLWHLARLAQGQATAGLDTGRAFAEDLVEKRPLPIAGRLPPGAWGRVLP